MLGAAVVQPDAYSRLSRSPSGPHLPVDAPLCSLLFHPPWLLLCVALPLDLLLLAPALSDLPARVASSAAAAGGSGNNLNSVQAADAAARTAAILS